MAPIKVAFIHPDLGIGGAERLVLDVAVALSRQDVQVFFITNHFDKTHAFDELKSGQFPVRVLGDWLPRSLCGKFHAFCAYVRMLYLSLVYMLFLRYQDSPDVYFVDQIPMAVPIITLFNGKVVYYCHHPDLLSSSHESNLEQIYRMPIDWVERCATNKSNIILVNSEYTASVFRETFPTIKTPIQILYPTIACSYQEMISTLSPKDITDLIKEINSDDSIVFLSVNRFHPAKKLELAIEAMESLKCKISEQNWRKTYLVVAGGYDPQSTINAKYFNELVNLVNKKDLTSNVIFLKSPSDAFKADLLLGCHCLIYTPVNEHFGIVPLEAMTAKKPVIACNSGGPRETVENNVTGYLCEPTADGLAEAMSKIFDKNEAKSMGQMGRKRLEDLFSYHTFYKQVMDIIVQAVGRKNVADTDSANEDVNQGVRNNADRPGTSRTNADIQKMIDEWNRNLSVLNGMTQLVEDNAVRIKEQIALQEKMRAKKAAQESITESAETTPEVASSSGQHFQYTNLHAKENVVIEIHPEPKVKKLNPADVKPQESLKLEDIPITKQPAKEDVLLKSQLETDDKISNVQSQEMLQPLKELSLEKKKILSANDNISPDISPEDEEKSVSEDVLDKTEELEVAENIPPTEENSSELFLKAEIKFEEETEGLSNPIDSVHSMPKN